MKIKNVNPEKYRFISTAPQDETYIDIFYRTSLFLDDLIHKYISDKYTKKYGYAFTAASQTNFSSP